MTRRLWVARALAGLGGADPSHRAIHVADGVITWTGGDPSEAPAADEVVDLGEAWLTPGFVDAHVHATETGLQGQEINLTGMGSVAEVLEAVRQHAATSPWPVVYGAGWDDLAWPEGRPPTAAELAEAAPGRMVVLVRIDGHSCVIDAGTLSGIDLRGQGDLVHRGRDGEPTGWLKESAAALAHHAMKAVQPQEQLDDARDTFCRTAVALGITGIHEMGVPIFADTSDAVAWATGAWPIDVIAYWGALSLDPEGLLRPGGDLFLDGSIGSCTAACSSPYRTNDGGTSEGHLVHDDQAVVDFYVAATRAGLGAGVHAIGDRAISQAVLAIEEAARVCGVEAVRAARHRIEHVEVVTREHVAAMARLGITASMQPAFDSTWNGPGGLYEHRFGRAAADETNPFSWFADAGVPMCFSSDTPVTTLDPWGGILAAERHFGGFSVDRRTALEAATIGGHRAVGREGEVGALLPGLRADFVAWPGDPLDADADPADWRPVATVVRGVQVY